MSNTEISDSHSQTEISNAPPHEAVEENGRESKTNEKRSSRERTLTEKGLSYEIAVFERKLKDAISKWRSCISKMTIVLADESDPKPIRETRDALVKTMDCVNESFSQLKIIEENHNVDCPKFTEFSDLIDRLEDEQKSIMLKIGDRIFEIESEKSEKRSFNSARAESKSIRSSRSNHSVRSEAAVEAAALKVKLKYVDSEAKSKANLDKIRLQRELEVAQAKLEAFDGSCKAISQKIGSCKDSVSEPDISAQLNEDYSRQYTIDYVNAHAHAQPSMDENIPSSHNLLQDKHLFSDQKSFAKIASVKFEKIDTPSLNPNAQPYIQSLHNSGPYHNDSHNLHIAEFSHPNEGLHNSEMFNSHESQHQGVRNTNCDNTEQNHPQQVFELTKTLLQQVNLSRLPPPEPSIFDGDPLKYPSWKSSFHILIEQKHIPAAEKIHYLRKYLSVQVREVVENYFLLTSEDAYEQAKDLLEQRFGDPFVIGDAFRDRLEKWPKIPARDSKSLQRFADFLSQCKAAMESISCLAVLDDCRQNRKLLLKLPEWMVNRWNRHVAVWKDRNGSFPPFKEFANFVSVEARVACDPVTSLTSLKMEQSADGTDDKVSKKGKYFNPKGRSLRTEVACASENNVKCFLCPREHELDKCEAFLAKTLEERKVFAREKRLCFACLGSSHVAKGCRSRKRCEKCDKLHPTSLHGDLRPLDKPKIAAQRDSAYSNKLKPDPSHASSFMGMSSTNPCMSSMILPVYISHKDFPECEKLVYALLDSQSDTTFLLESTRSHLGLPGVDVDLMLSTMHAENSVVKSKRVEGLTVRGLNKSVKIPLPITYTRQIMPANRSHIPTQEMAMKWNHLKCIANEFAPIQDCEVGLLIGYNCARALMPREIILPEDSQGPYAQRTDLGWGIVGVVDDMKNIRLDSVGISHRVVVCEVDQALSIQSVDGSSLAQNKVLHSLKTKVKEIINPVDIVRMMNLDFTEHVKMGNGLSIEDKDFLDKVQTGIRKEKGHYEMPLPLKDDNLKLPCNRSMAIHRLSCLRKRLGGDKRYCDHYCDFMQDMLNKGYAERVPDGCINKTDGKVWYIPHHGVYHPKKPDKIRIVFDCSATFAGQSLNKNLLQGPDLTNKLLGVLCRFRKEKIAFICDIEQMFFQFVVKPEQRDLLRFLWWEDRDFNKPPVEYRMCVHLFGAVSSPGCANFGLKQIASDGAQEFGSDASKFVNENFYVDDGLISVPSEDEAIDLICRSKDMCKNGGLRLHKFLSNSKRVIQNIPPEDRAKGLENVDLFSQPLPVERALGVQWCIESDSFQFRITLSDTPLTRRGILSTVSSVYDPLGLIAPVILTGKQILQQLCSEQKNWDDPISGEMVFRWEKWRQSLPKLSTIKIRRCFKSQDCRPVIKRELHHFSDASKQGYGQCSYLRIIDEQNQVHCSLVMAKSRVVPLKPITIPRLELTAALVSVKISNLIQEELDFENTADFFWTDSKIVLGYISNDSRRFHVYVSNRVQQIRDHTDPDQWRHIETSKNPADIASRGAYGNELADNFAWFNGPSFLWEKELSRARVDTFEVPKGDCELKGVQSFTTDTHELHFPSLISTFDSFSSWWRLKRVIAICLKFIRRLRRRETVHKHPNYDTLPKCVQLSVEDLLEAEVQIFKLAQFETFEKEIMSLRSKAGRHSGQKGTLSKGQSSIYRLDPYLDTDGVLRVGGRLSQMNVNHHIRHPVILPKHGHVTKLIIRFFHERVHHQGRGITSNEIRSHGLWIVGLSSSVYSYISSCVTCRRLRFSPLGQKMADLPTDRVEASPPFTYTGVDYFGPWYIHEGRKEIKRYGVLFTCLCCRAIHLETAVSLSTDSFINALRRFLSIRGPIRELRSDRGTNFIGAENELKEAVNEIDNAKVEQFLLQEGSNFVFNTNVPHSSHMGGVWERQIRSVRNVLSNLLYLHGQQLDDESLRTFMCEAAAIINSRPLAVQDLNDPLSSEPLTPNHLLTMKSNIILPPPGNFQISDLYSRKRWRRIQYLSNEFWLRWQKEYLQNLQLRNKWNSPKRNLRVGDIVLIVDQGCPRCHWQLGRIIECYPDKDNLVRKVKIAVGTKQLNSKGKRLETQTYLERQIHKLILLLETN